MSRWWVVIVVLFFVGTVLGKENDPLFDLKVRAEKGDAEAQYNLGGWYLERQGVANYPEAFKWINKAAEQGHPGAQTNLGFMYAQGLGVKRDNIEASNWYSQSAEQGLLKAQYGLGLMYANGQGVKQDYIEAYKWLRIAATAGDNSSSRVLSNLNSSMTTSQITEAEQRAATWLAKQKKQSLK